MSAFDFHKIEDEDIYMTNGDVKVDARRVIAEDGYILERELVAAGGCNNKGIFLARQEKPARLAVCKFLQPEPEARREADILRTISVHDGIPSLYDYKRGLDTNAKMQGVPLGLELQEGIEDWEDIQTQEVSQDETQVDRLYMEYCNGGSLNGYVKSFALRRELIPEAIIWHVAVSLLEALCFLHFGIHNVIGLDNDKDKEKWRPIMHSDLHGGNVLLTWPADATSPFGAPVETADVTLKAFPRIMLADFGAAQRLRPDGKFTTRALSKEVKDVGVLLEFLSQSPDILGHEESARTWEYSSELLQVIAELSKQRVVGSGREANLQAMTELLGDHLDAASALKMVREARKIATMDVQQVE